MTEQKPELPAIAVDQAEWRFAQQKESLKRLGPAAVLQSKNRLNSIGPFLSHFLLFIACLLFFIGIHQCFALGRQKKPTKEVHEFL